MAERTVGYVGNAELFGGGDEVVCLVQSLERGVFCLDGVDFGDWIARVSTVCIALEKQNVLELALRSVLAEHSDRPMYFVLPALRISSRAGIDSSSGVSGDQKSAAGSWKSQAARPTRIDTMQIVQIRRETQSLNRAIDVLFDMLG